MPDTLIVIVKCSFCGKVNVTETSTGDVYYMVILIVIILTMALMPSGYMNRLYRVSTVSFLSTYVVFCKSMGPVSNPSSAQNIENPAFLSPWIKVLKN